MINFQQNSIALCKIFFDKDVGKSIVNCRGILPNSPSKIFKKKYRSAAEH